MLSDFSGMLLLVVGLALLFDFSNGWHDSANAIATVVSTRVLTPAVAVLVAGLLNVAGAFMSAAFMAFSHGANDAQKAMGIITLALLSAGQITSAEVPMWVIVACALAMGLGTAVGGWKIVRTLGMRILKLEPVHGFAAETAAA